VGEPGLPLHGLRLWRRRRRRREEEEEEEEKGREAGEGRHRPRRLGCPGGCRRRRCPPLPVVEKGGREGGREGGKEGGGWENTRLRIVLEI